MNLQKLKEELAKKQDLASKYNNAAPNWPDHKKVLAEIAELNSQISKIQSVEPAPKLEPINLAQKIVWDNDKRINDISRFYDAAKNAIWINKAGSFRFWAWWSGKGVSLWVEKANIWKLNEDVATNVTQLEKDKNNTISQLEQAENSQLANLTQLDINKRNQEEQNKTSQLAADRQFEYQQAWMAENARQFDTIQWFLPVWESTLWDDWILYEKWGNTYVKSNGKFRLVKAKSSWGTKSSWSKSTWTSNSKKIYNASIDAANAAIDAYNNLLPKK